MPDIGYVLIGLAIGALPSLLLWALLRRKSDISEPLAGLERNLSASFNKASADMAARVEQIKGDVRTDLADRLGVLGARCTVEVVADHAAPLFGFGRYRLTGRGTKQDTQADPEQEPVTSIGRRLLGNPP